MEGNRMRFLRQSKSCQKNRPRDTFFILIAILCIVMMPLGAFSVRAEEKEYSVPAADFEVEIKNDGTVHVTENWEVSYTRGDFTRFYKDIYRTVPTEETFNLDEDSMKVSIDGKECAPAYNTTDRENYTFFLEKSFEEYTVHCFLASSHVNRKYQISYTIKDAVKKVDGEYYLVTFRMIGANFPKTVRHVSALYTAPEGSTVEVRNGQYFDKVVSEGNTVRVEDEYWDGVFKVKVRIDHASIANAVALTGDQLSNVDDNRQTKQGGEGSEWLETVAFILGLLVMLLVVCVPVGFILLIIFAIIWVIVRNFTTKRNVEKDPYYYFDIAGRWSGRLDPYEFAFGKPSMRKTNLFYVFFHQSAEMGCRRKKKRRWTFLSRKPGWTMESSV